MKSVLSDRRFDVIGVWVGLIECVEAIFVRTTGAVLAYQMATRRRERASHREGLR